MISVIIVSYNSSKTIKDCLTSVLQSLQAVEVIVVDNASTDNTVDIVKGFGSKVKLIESKENLGFSKGNNLGVKNSHGEYLIFLNPDTKLISKDTVEKLVKTLEENPGFGLIGPKLLYPDGTIRKTARNLPTVGGAIGEYILKREGVYDFYQPGGSTLIEVESVVGACMVIKKRLFERVGGFDEKYFLYFEDLQLCKDIRSAGFKVGYLPEVKVEHIEGVSGAGGKTMDFLKESSRKYHGLLNNFLIQSIIRAGQVLDKF